MPIVSALKILFCNLKLVAKVAVFLIIALAIFGLIVSAIISPTINEITELIGSINVNAEDFINHPFVTTQQQILDPIVNYIRSIGIGKTIWLFILLVFAANYLVNALILPVSKVMFTKVTTGYDSGLFKVVISTLPGNLLFTLLISVYSTIFSTGIFALVIFLFEILFKTGLLVLSPLVVMLGALLVTVKDSIICYMGPAIADSGKKNIFIGMGNSFKGAFKLYRKNLLCLLAINVIELSIVTSSLVLSVGVVPLISIPVYLVVYCTLSSLLYCSWQNRKYYTDNGITVYDPNSTLEK